MKLLSIDYGLKHIGLAVSDGNLAEPYSQFINQSTEISCFRLAQICHDLNIEKVVVGISESQMALKTKAFATILKKYLDAEVILVDETLSSHLAQQYLVNSGAKRKKRQQKNHQVAAAVILQNYLDSHS